MQQLESRKLSASNEPLWTVREYSERLAMLQGRRISPTGALQRFTPHHVHKDNWQWEDQPAELQEGHIEIMSRHLSLIGVFDSLRDLYGDFFKEIGIEGRVIAVPNSHLNERGSVSLQIFSQGNIWPGDKTTEFFTDIDFSPLVAEPEDDQSEANNPRNIISPAVNLSLMDGSFKVDVAIGYRERRTAQTIYAYIKRAVKYNSKHNGGPSLKKFRVPRTGQDLVTALLVE